MYFQFHNVYSHLRSTSFPVKAQVLTKKKKLVSILYMVDNQLYIEFSIILLVKLSFSLYYLRNI